MNPSRLQRFHCLSLTLNKWFVTMSMRDPSLPLLTGRRGSKSRVCRRESPISTKRMKFSIRRRIDVVLARSYWKRALGTVWPR
ncbi:hypothetical protein AB1N83_005277 [Pleurotus pulmonarius]